MKMQPTVVAFCLVSLLLANLPCATANAGQRVTSRRPATQWEEAYVTGNGRMGAMLFGDPTEETLIANHCRLYLPLGSREIVPKLAGHLPEMRQLIRQQGYGRAMEFLLGKARSQGFPGLTPTDPFHPAFFVNVRQTAEGPIQDYLRTEDLRTGEVSVRWRDARGVFQRRLFVSRSENVIVLSLTGPGKDSLDCQLLFPPVAPAARDDVSGGWTTEVESSLIDSQQQTRDDWVTYHNTYTQGKGGYDAAVRIVARGGELQAEGGAIQVSGAENVLLLMRVVPWKTPLSKQQSEAWAYDPENPDFTQRAGQFQPAPQLADSSVVPYRTSAEAAALLPQLERSVAALQPEYEALFRPHAQAHAALFDRVALDLNADVSSGVTTEEWIAVAQKEQRLPVPLMEQMYDAGRYMLICSAGELPPNLQGIWTGTWKPAWSGDFTLDTNVQLAIKHAFSANLSELMEGYYRLMESFYPEWRLNAERTYGCRGLLTNARASNTALLLHWGKWPGVCWTAGCGWLAHFFYDDWQYRGDERFLEQRTVPLLKEVVAFYEDFLVSDPATGLYDFIPSYSPETGCGINATMDVMVCKHALRSLIHACRLLEIEQGQIPKWEAMLSKLPPYRINEDGALAEWISEGFGEHYKHRHISHLYACYEALDDLTPESTPELWAAAQEATRRRIHSGGEVSSHGRVHMGLAAAHLGMAEEAYGRVEVMATGRSLYPSLMCSHEPNGRIYNLDANGAIPEILHRMLVRSQPGQLDLLPALPAAWPRGEICGIRARQQITISRLAWDHPRRQLTLQIVSDKDQTLTLRLPAMDPLKRITIDQAKTDLQEVVLQEIVDSRNSRQVALSQATPVTLEIRY